MGRRILSMQRDITDCGAACLASVAGYYRLQLPISRIRAYAGTDKHGTNVFGIVEAAKRLNFQAKGVRGNAENLFSLPLPCIALLQLENGLMHYVVIYKITKDRVHIMDPGQGRMNKLRRETFTKQWTGVAIL